MHQGDGAPAQAAFNLAGGDDLLEAWHPWWNDLTWKNSCFVWGHLQLMDKFGEDALGPMGKKAFCTDVDS